MDNSVGNIIATTVLKFKINEDANYSELHRINLPLADRIQIISNHKFCSMTNAI